MADVLTRICDDKRSHVARMKAERPLLSVEAAARLTPAPLGFARALGRAVAASGTGLIAEIKRASPSAGEIRPDFDPAALAAAYREGGAACLSVLTDEPYFKGRDGYVAEAKAASCLPCLRKDFMVDTYQVAEARAIGADCILVIMAAVDDGLAAELVAAARDWELDALIEVHDGEELDRALRLDARLVGINNRNLKTLAVDLATTEALAPRVPGDRDVVCESGIRRHEDLVRMGSCGVGRFLVGEHLMRQADVAAATRELLGTSRWAPAGRAAEMAGRLTHLDEAGRARMVDVSGKEETTRVAVAEGRVVMEPATLIMIAEGAVPKGDVFAVARVAGIMAAKKTSELIPLCHPIALASVEVELAADPAGPAVTIRATCKLAGRTGVEMEALTAVSAAALTVYDMCKAVDRGMTIEAVRLVHKSGGKSGTWGRP